MAKPDNDNKNFSGATEWAKFGMGLLREENSSTELPPTKPPDSQGGGEYPPVETNTEGGQGGEIPEQKTRTWSKKFLGIFILLLVAGITLLEIYFDFSDKIAGEEKQCPTISPTEVSHQPKATVIPNSVSFQYLYESQPYHPFFSDIKQEGCLSSENGFKEYWMPFPVLGGAYIEIEIGVADDGFSVTVYKLSNEYPFTPGETIELKRNGSTYSFTTTEGGNYGLLANQSSGTVQQKPIDYVLTLHMYQLCVMNVKVPSGMQGVPIYDVPNGNLVNDPAYPVGTQTQISVVGKQNGWYQVLYPNAPKGLGWVDHQYLYTTNITPACVAVENIIIQ